jgi:hypothetical protein
LEEDVCGGYLMGTYTYVVEDNIEVADAKGLKEWAMSKGAPEYVTNVKEREGDCKDEYNFWKDRLRSSVNKGYTDINFDEMVADAKLAGYWYVGEGYFFRDLAQFIEGELMIKDENDECYTKLIFSNGDLYLVPGNVTIDWNEKKKEIADKWFGIPPLDARRKLARKI